MGRSSLREGRLLYVKLLVAGVLLSILGAWMGRADRFLGQVGSMLAFVGGLLTFYAAVALIVWFEAPRAFAAQTEGE